MDELLRRGYTVRALARPSSRAAALEKRGVEIARGDILDGASVERALTGCDLLFHAAAIYELWAPDPQLLIRTEVTGTVNVLEAALRARTPRVVYTSTAAAVGERRGETGTEETPHRGYFLSVYEKAKYDAEVRARRFVEQGLDLRIVQPAAVMGPGDLKPTGKGLLNALNGKFPLLFHGTLTGVDIRDAALVHVLAAEKGEPGRAYIAAAWVVSTKQWLAAACRLAGKRAPLFGPAVLAKLFAAGGEAYGRLAKTEPLLSLETYRLLRHGFRVDGSRAARELGASYRAFDESLRDAIAWYRDHGLIR